MKTDNLQKITEHFRPRNMVRNKFLDVTFVTGAVTALRQTRPMKSANTTASRQP